MTKLSSE